MKQEEKAMRLIEIAILRAKCVNLLESERVFMKLGFFRENQINKLLDNLSKLDELEKIAKNL